MHFYFKNIVIDSLYMCCVVGVSDFQSYITDTAPICHVCYRQFYASTQAKWRLDERLQSSV